MVVNPYYRKQGYGSKLVKDVAAMIKGDTYLSLLNNKKSLIDFYRKIGFEIHSKNELGEPIMIKNRRFKEWNTGSLEIKQPTNIVI